MVGANRQNVAAARKTATTMPTLWGRSQPRLPRKGSGFSHALSHVGCNIAHRLRERAPPSLPRRPSGRKRGRWCRTTIRALCKFVCHNLCCVILSQIELGIEAAFWQNDDGPRDVLPLARRG